MKYRALEFFTVETSRGELELSPGQIISLSEETALRLLSTWKIIPVEQGAHRVYSPLFRAAIWIVLNDEDLKALRASERVTEAIYTAEEIMKLKGLGEDSLRAIHNVKEVFELSVVQEVKKPH